MKQRNVLAVIVLSWVTLGIYALYWLVQTRREMVARGASIPRAWLLLAPVIAIFGVSVIQFVVRFILEGSINANGSGEFEPTTFTTAVNVLSVVVGVATVVGIIPLTLYWFYKYCQAIEFVTKGQTSVVLSFGMWLVFVLTGLILFWPGLMQDSFNRIKDAPTKSRSKKLKTA